MHVFISSNKIPRKPIKTIGNRYHSVADVPFVIFFFIQHENIEYSKIRHCVIKEKNHYGLLSYTNNTGDTLNWFLHSCGWQSIKLVKQIDN